MFVLPSRHFATFVNYEINGLINVIIILSFLKQFKVRISYENLNDKKVFSRNFLVP